MPIPAIIPALIAAAGTIGGASIQAASAKKNRESQERQNAIDRQRAASAYRTAVADMRAAGMNPITGQNPPQAASTPMPAPQSDMSGVGQVLQQGSSAIGDILQRTQQDLQTEALSWYQNQVTTTNGIINQLQTTVKDYHSQMNQQLEGLSEEAKAYLNSVEEEYQSSIQKISEVSDTQMFSVDQLNKLGITIAGTSTDETSDTEHKKSGHEYKLGITAQFSLKNFLSSLSAVAGAGGLWTGEEGEEHTKKNSSTVSAQGQQETTTGVKYVSGKEVKNAVTSYINELHRAKVEDSGSNKINENLRTIDRDSYIRLSIELVKTNSELRKYYKYADFLRDHPGDSLESYRGFIDGFKKNNDNPYKIPNDTKLRADQLDLLELNDENYPDTSGLKDKYSMYKELDKELEGLSDEEKGPLVKQLVIAARRKKHEIEYLKKNNTKK